MTLINHRPTAHQINLDTEILIIGTFNPDTPKNKADFFYGRHRNFLWVLLPQSFGIESLKGKSREDKIKFMREFKVDFTDLIASVDVEEETNYKDDYLDNKVISWTNNIEVIKSLPKLNRVCFTRKSFGGIPNMKLRIEEIRIFCESRNIEFEYLPTPARFYTEEKQIIWTKFFNKSTFYTF